MEAAYAGVCVCVTTSFHKKKTPSTHKTHTQRERRRPKQSQHTQHDTHKKKKEVGETDSSDHVKQNKNGQGHHVEYFLVLPRPSPSPSLFSLSLALDRKESLPDERTTPQSPVLILLVRAKRPEICRYQSRRRIHSPGGKHVLTPLSNPTEKANDRSHRNLNHFNTHHKLSRRPNHKSSNNHQSRSSEF